LYFSSFKYRLVHVIQRFKMQNYIPFIPSCVFISGLLNKTNLYLYEFSLLRLVNKEFNKEFNFNKNNIIKVRLENYPELFEISKLNNTDLLDELVNSDFNITEFDRICNNMHAMQYRNYGIKYGYLFRHKFFDKCDQIKLHTDKNNIGNNINIFRIMFDYSRILTTKQQRAPTDIQKYTYLWLSDYMFNVINYKLGSNIIQHSILGLIGRGLLEDMLIQCNYNFNILDFYEILVISRNTNLHNKYLESNIKTHTYKEFCIILKIFIAIYDGYKYYTKDYLDFMFLHIILFVKNSLNEIGKIYFPQEFLASLHDKAHETIEIIEINKINNTETTIQLKIEDSCNEIINILI